MCLRSQAICVHQFPDEVFAVVYDGDSGDTHLIDTVAFELCQRLSDAPVAIDALTQSMVEAFPEDAPSALANEISRALTELEAINLITVRKY